MSLSSEFLEIIYRLSEECSIPSIKDIIIPNNIENSKSSNFAAIILDDNSIGIFFINLTLEIKKLIIKTDFKDFIGENPSDLA